MPPNRACPTPGQIHRHGLNAAIDALGLPPERSSDKEGWRCLADTSRRSERGSVTGLTGARCLVDQLGSGWCPSLGPDNASLDTPKGPACR
jgi:hypothetical protein